MLVKLLTLKCYANTFVKVEGQIEEECRRTISYPMKKGILTQSFIVRNWVIRKLRPRRIQLALQEEQLYAECRWD